MERPRRRSKRSSTMVSSAKSLCPLNGFICVDRREKDDYSIRLLQSDKDIDSQQCSCVLILEEGAKMPLEFQEWAYELVTETFPDVKETDEKRREMFPERFEWSSYHPGGPDVERRRMYLRDSKLRGFLGFEFLVEFERDPVCYVLELHVSSKHQGCGIGGSLLAAVEWLARTCGLQRVMLSSFMWNEKAVAFYRKRGYADHEGESPAYLYFDKKSEEYGTLEGVENRGSWEYHIMYKDFD